MTEATDSPTEHTLYVHNLYDKLPLPKLKEHLYVLFSTYGEVLDVNVSPELRGQAFVIFSSNQGAKSALRSVQGEEFFGKEIKVEWSRAEGRLVESLR